MNRAEIIRDARLAREALRAPVAMYDPGGFFGSTVGLENPTGDTDADRAIDKAGKLVAALGPAEKQLVYSILHAEGCRVQQGSYVDAYRRARAKGQ